jgi:hypothetical protein
MTDIDLDKSVFYIGSCRYQSLFPQNFPPRLHTTKEVIHFLRHVDTMDKYLEHPYLNSIFGDCIGCKDIKTSFIEFIEKRKEFMNGINTVVLELCSRKVAYINNIPVSHFFSKKLITENIAKEVILTNNVIRDDLIIIKNILKRKYNIDNLVVIPHINLKLKGTGKEIPSRHGLTSALKFICEKLDITFIDIEKGFSGYLDDVLRDGNHFNKYSRYTAYKYVCETLGISINNIIKFEQDIKNDKVENTKAE